ncbi:MAG TPA: hypothetical protein VGC84_16940 [Ilumatobacteraceae bacterium]|jgi:hypothetical protein
MATLQDYVAKQFPQHNIDASSPMNPPDLELTDHTVVSYVVGARDGLDLLSAFRHSAPKARVAAVEVRPTDATVVPTQDEDRDGIVDVPDRRLRSAVAVGAVCGALVVGGLALALSGSVLVTIITAVFGAFIGIAVGFIVAGGRFAGERAVTQPRAPGQTITVVAAFLEDPDSAATLARTVGPAAGYEVRIVDHQGGWRSPGPGRADGGGDERNN